MSTKKKAKRKDDDADDDSPPSSPREEEEGEEEESCGFCTFMKGGSCRAEFVAWEKCVDDAKAKKEDFVEKCFEQTKHLRECMLRDPEYYGEMEDDGGGGEGGDGKETNKT